MSADAWDPGAHPVLAALEQARRALAAAAAGPEWSLSDAQTTAALEQALAVRAQAEAVTAGLVAQAEARVLGAELNQPDTGRWLRRRFQLGAGEAVRLRALARALPPCPATAAALAAGRVGAGQAAAIARALAELPDSTGPAERVRAEALLVEQAATLDPEELARCGRALREALTVLPDADDPTEAARVAAEAAAADDRARTQADARRLRLTSRRDGMVGVDGLLDPLAGAVVRAALAARAVRHGDDDGVRDERTRPMRLADALHELAATAAPITDPARPDPAPAPAPATAPSRRVPADQDDPGAQAGDPMDPAADPGYGAPAGPPHPAVPAAGPGYGAPAGPANGGRIAARRGATQVSLVIRWETLHALAPRAGMLDDGTELAPGQLLTALCEARVLPMVFAGPAQPLHLGRRRRLFTPAQHAVLAARDRGCAFPGCTRAPAGCTAHHLRDWTARHGATDIDNGCLLCPYHHALVHREGWQTRLAGNGYPEFVPPPGYDPHRRPRQHLRYRTTPSTGPPTGTAAA